MAQISLLWHVKGPNFFAYHIIFSKEGFDYSVSTGNIKCVLKLNLMRTWQNYYLLCAAEKIFSYMRGMKMITEHDQ
jgi:hypothetical protein